MNGTEQKSRSDSFDRSGVIERFIKKTKLTLTASQLIDLLQAHRAFEDKPETEQRLKEIESRLARLEAQSAFGGQRRLA